jgi:uncharacterized protein
MTARKSFTPGSVCWADLATTDWQDARRFYTALFGWSVEERPIGPSSPPYVLLKKGDAVAAALYQQDEEHRLLEMPPAWQVYFHVDDVDAVTKKARELGANVVTEPLDVQEAGRTALLQDPQSAMFALWKGKKRPGLGVLDEPGSLCWVELQTTDTTAAKTFYTSLFGWKTKDDPAYTEWINGGAHIGGMLKQPPEQEGVPPSWVVYFAVDDCDAVARRVQDLGGELHYGPEDIPRVGRFAVVMDPQGAPFCVIKLEPRG